MSIKNYFISVAEPWDFESPDGQNIINGRIIKIVSNTCLIFKSDYKLDLKGHSGDILILKPRHKGNDFDDLKCGQQYVVINGSLLLCDFEEKMLESELKVSSEFGIIGSVRPVTASIS